MLPKLPEFADILWGTGVLYQVKLLGSKGLKNRKLYIIIINAVMQDFYKINYLCMLHSSQFFYMHEFKFYDVPCSMKELQYSELHAIVSPMPTMPRDHESISTNVAGTLYDTSLLIGGCLSQV